MIGGKYLLLGIQTKVIVAVPRTALPQWDVPIWIRLALICVVLLLALSFLVIYC